MSDPVTSFLDDLVSVYEKHHLSLSHEDGQGAFIVQPLSQGNIRWLRDASIDDSVTLRAPRTPREEQS